MSLRALPAAAAVVALAVGLPQAAFAQRPARPVEARAITAAVTAAGGMSRPQRACVRVAVRVSTVDPRFAVAWLTARRPSCERWLANGGWIVHHEGRTWRMVYDGSDPPSCDSLIPARVTRDLLGTGCLR